MGIAPVIRDVLGSLNESDELAIGLQAAFSFNAAGVPVDLVNPKRTVTVSTYAFDATGANGPSIKSNGTLGYLRIAPAIPVKNGCWTVSSMTRFPVDNHDFSVLAANRTANLYHVLKNATTGELITWDGSARLFSPTIDVIAMSGWKRLTVCGHPGGARAYVDGVFAGSHAFVLNSNIENMLGEHVGTNRSWGAAKDWFGWNRTLGPGEVMEHAIDPFVMFAEDLATNWLQASGAPPPDAIPFSRASRLTYLRM